MASGSPRSATRTQRVSHLTCDHTEQRERCTLNARADDADVFPVADANSWSYALLKSEAIVSNGDRWRVHAATQVADSALSDHA